MVRKIINITKDFYTKNNKSSFLSLLRDTGYLETDTQIYEKDIYEELIKCPDCVQYWLQWSEDKRVSSGWYFLKTSGGRYVVSYYSIENGESPEIIFDDEYTACANYILREIQRDKNGKKKHDWKR